MARIDATPVYIRNQDDPQPLTAEEARAMLPVVSVDAVVVAISKKIAEAARAGKLQIDAYDLMPKLSGWDVSRANDLRHSVFGALRALGYTVRPFSADHGAAAVIVDWAN